MAEHALLSPSAAHRWLACPPSVAREAGYKGKSSSAADYGTACHELAQWTLTGVGKDCSHYLGLKTKAGLAITNPMVELTQNYVNNLLDYARGNTLMVEYRVDFSNYLGVPDCFGTSDGIVITRDLTEIQIHDLKTGYHIVEAAWNPQLMLYGLGALHEFGMLGQFKRFRFVIHQPGSNHLDEWDCTLEELLDFAARAKPKARQALQLLNDNKPIPIELFYPTEKGCQYCRAAAGCPGLEAKVQALVGAEFEDLTAPTTMQVANLVPKEPQQLSVKMAATPLIENWIKSVRSEVERELLAGVQIPGFKLVRGKAGNRRWTDEKEVTKQMKGLKLSKDQMYHSILITPTDAEKLLRIAPDKWATLAPFITRSEGSLSVAPESDKRPAIDVTPVADQFEDLTANDLI